MKLFEVFIVVLAALIIPLQFNVVTSYNEACFAPPGSSAASLTKCFPMMRLWTYREDLNKCVRFRGCGDSENQFQRKRECVEECKQ
uniref:BPTI/Kunitz inhibitor domain-containing protein n=1 Tax=Glossina austeni TaxID=7395 RepID=A0A1A9V0W8_GLOAU